MNIIEEVKEVEKIVKVKAKVYILELSETEFSILGGLCGIVSYSPKFIEDIYDKAYDGDIGFCPSQKYFPEGHAKYEAKD